MRLILEKYLDKDREREDAKTKVDKTASSSSRLLLYNNLTTSYLATRRELRANS